LGPITTEVFEGRKRTFVGEFDTNSEAWAVSRRLKSMGYKSIKDDHGDPLDTDEKFEASRALKAEMASTGDAAPIEFFRDFFTSRYSSSRYDNFYPWGPCE